MTDTLSAVINILAAAMQSTAQAALKNPRATEWVIAAALAGSAWMLSSGPGWRAVGVLVFLVAVGASAGLLWRMGGAGVLAQQAVMAAMVLHGLAHQGLRGGGK